METASGHPIAVLPTTEDPYGFTVECSNPARKFTALAGSTIVAHVLYKGGMDLEGSDLVILPLWPGGAKDHIVGVLVSREIKPVIVGCALAGVIALIASTCMFLRKRSIVRR